MRIDAKRAARLALVLLAMLVWGLLQWQRGGEPAPAPPVGRSESAQAETGAWSAERAWTERRSGVWIEVDGTVERVLPDDRHGSRHQRFILALPSGQTLLVAHNIDLAPRVPLGEGDGVAAFGEYEWNDRGGVLHWTHHDPRGRRSGGWIRHGGRDYR